MPNCDFYALGADVEAVLDFVFAQPDRPRLKVPGTCRRNETLVSRAKP